MVAIEFARYAYMAGFTIFTSEDVVCDEECDSYWSVKILALVSVWIATVRLPSLAPPVRVPPTVPPPLTRPRARRWSTASPPRWPRAWCT